MRGKFVGIPQALTPLIALPGGWPALPARGSHPLEYTTLPSRTDPFNPSGLLRTFACYQRRGFH
jgi:hypothetical protein